MAVEKGSLSISVSKDGRKIFTKTLTPEKRYFPIVLFASGQPGVAKGGELAAADAANLHQVTIETTEPCAEANDDCRGFLIFNPQEFYLLDIDAAEQDNRFGDAEYQNDIQILRAQLNRALTRRTKGSSEKIEMDDEIRRQLKSLGYLN
jgi:hypothetical protein